MKKNQIKELHSKSKEELLKQVLDLRREFSKLRLDVVSGKSKNTAALKEKRKDIARALSALKLRELIVMTQPEVPSQKQERKEN